MTYGSGNGRKSTTAVVPDWRELAPGDLVTVVDSHSVLHSGWIDDVTEDGSVLWLVQVGGRGRKMFLREDGGLVTMDTVPSETAPVAGARANA
ncbi:hypothetical protein [Arthrobacter sp. M4]|uniref:hypothetical protein n=1 Tax=Arthrobacter sp. M4 TaxID=218160 RepID=UPI001CDC2A49|nr:hypothetical protein [Arthrobacter sp. M4]MCA4134548.1 hypothetical protein [Arthrobacter sp. M4]